MPGQKLRLFWLFTAVFSYHPHEMALARRQLWLLATHMYNYFKKQVLLSILSLISWKSVCFFQPKNSEDCHNSPNFAQNLPKQWQIPLEFLSFAMICLIYYLIYRVQTSKLNDTVFYQAKLWNKSIILEVI